MNIDSLVVSIPSEVFVPVVIYENALGRMRGLIRKDWSTDMKYHPPRGFYDGMDGRLHSRYRFSWVEESTSSKGYGLHQPQWQYRASL